LIPRIYSANAETYEASSQSVGCDQSCDHGNCPSINAVLGQVWFNISAAGRPVSRQTWRSKLV